jgi:nitrogen PTS system EIIA component
MSGNRRQSDIGRQINALPVLALTATRKEAAVREIIEDLVSNHLLGPDMTESVIRGVLGSEELGSSGIGQGVATPHVRVPISKTIVRLARSSAGVEWNALDNEPVCIFFLRVIAISQPGENLRIIEHFSRVIKDESVFSIFLDGDSNAIAKLFDDTIL